MDCPGSLCALGAMVARMRRADNASRTRSGAGMRSGRGASGGRRKLMEFGLARNLRMGHVGYGSSSRRWLKWCTLDDEKMSSQPAELLSCRSPGSQFQMHKCALLRRRSKSVPQLSRPYNLPTPPAPRLLLPFNSECLLVTCLTTQQLTCPTPPPAMHIWIFSFYSYNCTMMA